MLTSHKTSYLFSSGCLFEQYIGVNIWFLIATDRRPSHWQTHLHTVCFYTLKSLFTSMFLYQC